MKAIFLIFFFLFSLPSAYAAEDFLGVPLVPDGKVAERTESRLELTTDASHDEVLAYYKEALKGEKDIKFRDWSDSTYIEDDGGRPWHSITIAKEAAAGQKGTTVLVKKDSWGWIIGTLILRFIGVFVVLLIVYLGLTVSGGIISRVVKASQARKELAKSS